MGGNGADKFKHHNYVFVFCGILKHYLAHCGNSNTNISNYTIITTNKIGYQEYEMCTVHLKSFTNKRAELETLHQIVDANQGNHVLWTIWDYNASKSVNPSIHFYESCSINVVLDFLPFNSPTLIRNYVQLDNEYS
jgi:hypothetical protein